MHVHFGQPTPSWHLPPNKRDELIGVADAIVRDATKGPVQCKAVARCVGKLISATRAVPLARMLFRELNWSIYAKGSPDWHGSLTLSREALDDLKWILQCFRPFNLRGSPIWVSSTIEQVDRVLIQDSGPRAVGFSVHETSALAAVSADTLPIGETKLLVGRDGRASDSSLAPGASSKPAEAPRSHKEPVPLLCGCWVMLDLSTVS